MRSVTRPTPGASRSAIGTIPLRLFIFFNSSVVTPAKKAAEQDFRPSVIHRKVTGGYRSQLGADISTVFISLLSTARKRGENLFDALRSTAGPSPIMLPGIPC